MTARRVFVVAIAVALAGCREPTQVTFEVRSDLRCDEISDTTITTGTAADVDTKAATTTSTTCVDGRIGALVVTPAGDDDAELAVRVVTATKGKRAEDCADTGYKGCIVSRRAVRFSAHKPLRLSVMMRASCIDAPCEGAGFTTCVKGTCVSARLDAGACETEVCDEARLDAKGTDATCPPAPLPPGAKPTGWSSIAGFGGITPRRGSATLVWTCGEAILWGGASDVLSKTAPGEGAAYSPTTNTWRRIRPAPFASRVLHAAVWTGREMFVWGGLSFKENPKDGASIFADGALYNPVADVWTTLPQDPLLAALVIPAVVYSPVTDEVIVWGAEFVDPPRSSGAAFSLKTRTWRRIAQPTGFQPRRAPTAAFVDGKMIVAGGELLTADTPQYLADGAAYDPVADRWSLVPPSGVKLPVGETFRGRQVGKSILIVTGIAPNDGAYFDGTAWTPIPALAASTIVSPQRRGSAVFASDRQLFRWGGISGQSTPYVDGVALDVTTRTWSKMPPSALPTARTAPSAVWTGTYAIVAGGTSGPTSFDDAAIFVP